MYYSNAQLAFINSSRPGAKGAFRGRAPQITACSSPNKNCAPPPSEDCAPKKVTSSVPLECSSRPETPKILLTTLEFVSKNCFFADFAIKTLCLCDFTPEFVKICAVFEMKNFLFGLHPIMRGNSQWRPLIFGPHSRIRSILFFVPASKFVYAP